jgi:hypothetical protein
LLLLLSRFADHALEFREILLRESGRRRVEERGGRGFGGSVEKRCDQTLDSGFLCGFAFNRRQIDVSKAFFDVVNMTFALQYSEDGPDRGVAGPIHDSFLNFLARGPAKGEENIHDLALAAA